MSDASYDWQADALEWRLNAMSAKKRIAALENELAEERARLDAQEAQLPKGFGWYICPLDSGGWLIQMYRLDCAAAGRIATYPTLRAVIDAARAGGKKTA